MQVEPESKVEESKPVNSTPIKPNKSEAGLVKQGKKHA